MTFIAVLLLGGGVLLIISSLDNTPIIETTQKILKGQAINYSGDTSSTSSSTPGQAQAPAIPILPSLPGNSNHFFM